MSANTADAAASMGIGSPTFSCSYNPAPGPPGTCTSVPTIALPPSSTPMLPPTTLKFPASMFTRFSYPSLMLANSPNASNEFKSASIMGNSSLCTCPAAVPITSVIKNCPDAPVPVPYVPVK